MSAYVVIVYYQEKYEKPHVSCFATDEEAEAAIIEDAQGDWREMLFPDDQKEVEYPTTLEQAFALHEYMYDNRKVWLIRSGEAYHHERKEES